MPKNKIFHIRKTANKDLESIFIYSVENFGMERAERYIDDLVSAFQTLANNYNQGKDCSHVRPNLYSHNVCIPCNLL